MAQVGTGPQRMDAGDRVEGPPEAMMRFVVPAAAFVLGAVFLFAGVDKLAHYEGFVNALNSYPLISAELAAGLAAPVVALELGVGFGLLVPASRRLASAAAAVLLLVFTVALATSALTQPGSVCGCWFTLTLAKSPSMHLAQNLILCALAASVWHSFREGSPSAGPITADGRRVEEE